MANVPDNKKGWSFIKAAQELIASDEGWALLRTKFQNAGLNINAAGFPLTAQEVSDINDFIVAHNTLMTDHAAILTILKNKNIGSHKGNALD